MIKDMLGIALAIAGNAHDGQVDKQGKPYILHPLRLMMRQHIDDTAGQIVPLLHDVVEDSAWTLEEIMSYGFSDEVLTAVDVLTKRKDDAYATYLERVKLNPLARRIKIDDLYDNLDRIPALRKVAPETANRLFIKYVTALSLFGIEEFRLDDAYVD